MSFIVKSRLAVLAFAGQAAPVFVPVVFHGVGTTSVSRASPNAATVARIHRTRICLLLPSLNQVRAAPPERTSSSAPLRLAPRDPPTRTYGRHPTRRPPGVPSLARPPRAQPPKADRTRKTA